MDLIMIVTLAQLLTKKLQWGTIEHVLFLLQEKTKKKNA